MHLYAHTHTQGMHKQAIGFPCKHTPSKHASHVSAHLPQSMHPQTHVLSHTKSTHTVTHVHVYTYPCTSVFHNCTLAEGTWQDAQWLHLQTDAAEIHKLLITGAGEMAPESAGHRSRKTKIRSQNPCEKASVVTFISNPSPGSQRQVDTCWPASPDNP